MVSAVGDTDNELFTKYPNPIAFTFTIKSKNGLNQPT
jgi:hypothetical protein